MNQEYSGSAAVKGQYANQVMKETLLSKMRVAVDLAHEARARTTSVANALDGEAADEQSRGQPAAPARPGILGSFEDIADEVSRIASSIVSDMSRIERRL